MAKASLPELPTGVRSTAARRAVLRAVEASPGRFTVAELYTRARELHPPLGLATTYRTLELLRDAGSVRALPGDERPSYVKCHPGHHHHLVCTKCGSVEETELCAAPTEQELRRRHGFVPDSHEVDIYGRCARCA